MKLIVGLGNPGEKYIGTRHNLGFLVLDEYIKKHNLGTWNLQPKLKSEVIQTPDVLFARPQTHMNKSGLAIQAISAYFKIKPKDIIIAYDELDLPLGHIKIRLGGAAAGHHGVESIIEALSSDKFTRLRLGIGTEKALSGEHKAISFSAERFVLEPFTQKERSELKHLVKRALEAIKICLNESVQTAQNQFN